VTNPSVPPYPTPSTLDSQLGRTYDVVKAIYTGCLAIGAIAATADGTLLTLSLNKDSPLPLAIGGIALLCVVAALQTAGRALSGVIAVGMRLEEQLGLGKREGVLPALLAGAFNAEGFVAFHKTAMVDESVTTTVWLTDVTRFRVFWFRGFTRVALILAAAQLVGAAYWYWAF
jgi:hypothetical protein